MKEKLGVCEMCVKDIFCVSKDLPNNADDACIISLMDNCVRISGHYGSREFDYGLARFESLPLIEKLQDKLQTNHELYICDDCVKQGIKNGSIVVIDELFSAYANPFNFIEYPNHYEKDESELITSLKGLIERNEIYIPIRQNCICINVIKENLERICKIINKHAYLKEKFNAIVEDDTLVITTKTNVYVTSVDEEDKMVFIIYGSGYNKQQMFIREDQFKLLFEHI